MAQNIDSVPKKNIPENKSVTREKFRVVSFTFRCVQNQNVANMLKYTWHIASLSNIGAEMLDDVQAPIMQTNGTTNTKAETGNDELILCDSPPGDGTNHLFRVTFIIISLDG